MIVESYDSGPASWTRLLGTLPPAVTQIQRRYTALAAQLSRLRQQIGALRKDYADLLDGRMETGISQVMNQVEGDLMNMERIVTSRITGDGATGIGVPSVDGEADD